MVTMSQDTPPVVVVGAGPVGCVLATCLARRGRRVRVFEQRADPRAGAAGWGAEGRSINLVVTGRGFAALERFGLADALRAISVPIRGRMVHKADGSTAYQPYGIGHEANYSISRGEMNKELMTLAEEVRVRPESALRARSGTSNSRACAVAAHTPRATKLALTARRNSRTHTPFPSSCATRPRRRPALRSPSAPRTMRKRARRSPADTW